MAISLTSFKGIFDNKPHQINFEDWEHFAIFLEALTKRKLESKKDGELISPAIYEPGTTRANRNVICWAGWAAVDVDDHDYVDVEKEVYDEFKDIEYVIYSTASSTEAKPKFRIVFELSRSVKADEIRAMWFALQSRVSDRGDKQCKDYSRMYYVPANYSLAHNFFYRNYGTPLDVDALMRDYPYAVKKISHNFMDRLPESVQSKVIKHRQNKMERNVSWSDYRDCPFWPKRMAAEYIMITDTGWYSKMYQIMLAIAGHAIYKEYPITSAEISSLCKGFDQDNGNWYANRPIEREADRAIEYAYRKG